MALHTIDLDFAGEPADFGVTTVVDMVRVWNSEVPNVGAMVIKPVGAAGWPVVRIGATSEDAIMDALMLYCDNDLEQALDLFEFVTNA